MVDMASIAGGTFSHDLLLHENDEELVAVTRAFVEQGLSSGGEVLVHGTRERVAMMREVLGSQPRLAYGFDEDLYVSPARTLFSYQREVAESRESTEVWSTGTVPFGDDPANFPGWARYESMVDEALGGFAFHGLCTYDVHTLPAPVITAARETHPSVVVAGERAHNPAYLTPAAFLETPLAAPLIPASPPTAVLVLRSTEELAWSRTVLGSVASEGAIDQPTVGGLVSAVHEILLNGLIHGAAPVELTVWREATRLTCRIVDAGAGICDTLGGCTHSDAGPSGLWLARQLCEDVLIENRPDGCQVVLTTG